MTILLIRFRLPFLPEGGDRRERGCPAGHIRADRQLSLLAAPPSWTRSVDRWLCVPAFRRVCPFQKPCVRVALFKASDARRLPTGPPLLPSQVPISLCRDSRHACFPPRP